MLKSFSVVSKGKNPSRESLKKILNVGSRHIIAIQLHDYSLTLRFWKVFRQLSVQDCIDTAIHALLNSAQLILNRASPRSFLDKHHFPLVR